MLPDATAVLRGARLRVTQPRLAVLAAVHELPHADTESLIAAVRRELPDVSHQAVYDSLHTLTDRGILRRIQPAGSVARYETRVGDNHHHLVCRSCGTVVDVDCAVGETVCLVPADARGFRVDEAEVVYWGLCPRCAADADAADAADGAGAPTPATPTTDHPAVPAAAPRPTTDLPHTTEGPS